MAGSQVTEINEDRERRISYEFNDRGRGPKLTVRVRVGSDGTPVLVESSGYNYWKTKVDDRFSLDGQRAIWRNGVDSGEKTISAPAFYVATSSTPEQWALLARALLAAPDRKLALLPLGEARIEKGDELEVRAGGQARKVARYEIYGLGLEPFSIWLDEKGQFFADVSAWSALVLEGWKEVRSLLLESQERSTAIRSEKMASALARRLSPSWVIRGANVFDAEHGTMHRDYAIVGSGGRIDAVGPASRLKVPSGAEVIDASGKCVLPGLWDMHAHFFESQGPLYIASGVTTVRDLANDIDVLSDLRHRINEGKAIGPRVIPAGFLDGSGPYAGPTTVLVDTEEEARAAIDRYARLKYEQIKIYSSIKPEHVPFIVKHSHQLGLRVSGHVPAGMNAEEAVRMGFDELQHVNFLFLNFLVDKAADTRTPLRFTAIAEHAAELELDSPKVQSFIALLKQRNIVVDPTVSTFEDMLLARVGEISPTYASIAAKLPPLTRRGFLAGGLGVAPEIESRKQPAFEALLKMVAVLHRAGIPIVAGTDAPFPGFVLHRELELYVRA
ncbi:MAG TPA: hypothetical protein VKE49_10150, partial [Myxococcaceae bacterium]|nr:hypothetical protein [Myxococcaceae bacterium]